MIIRTADSLTPPESTNDTSCVNISAHFGVWKKRNRFFSFAFSGFWGGPGVRRFGKKVESVRFLRVRSLRVRFLRVLEVPPSFNGTACYGEVCSPL